MDKKKVNGIEIQLLASEETIKDNLERIGIVNRIQRKLYPSCYLVTDDSKHYICHFKDLLKVEMANENDKLRRNTITWLLDKWQLIKIIGNKEEYPIQKKKIFILTKEQKVNENWEIIHKYHYLNKNNEVNTGGN